MNERHVFCEEHGYLGESAHLATIEFLIAQELLKEGEHHCYVSVDGKAVKATTNPPDEKGEE